jgi:outer membrane protein OmpA-like peptidoglycan-associated protein
LGEIVVDPSNKAKISVTTDLQALGLMVTAEPYYSVTAPSDVVVVENVVRPDTIGRVEEVSAKYDLLPRGQYTLNLNPTQLRTVDNEAEKLPYDRYEAVLELYQAQNAVQIARSLGADHYAGDTLSKAETLLGEAQSLQARKQDTHMIVSRAREAAQMAEDARMITVKRRDQDRLSHERQQELEESQAQTRAHTEAEEAQAQAAADRSAAESERATAERDRAAAQRDRLEAERERAVTPRPTTHAAVSDDSASVTRSELLTRMNSILPTRDTPRGLVITIPDSMLETSPRNPAPAASPRIASIAKMLAGYPGLYVRTEGYADDRGSELDARTFSQRGAEVVRDILVLNGLAPGAVTAAGYGKDHPIASNEAESGRQQNRRVEIVISGRPIGEQAYRR